MEPFLSVVIPAFNEAKRLPATIVDIDNYLSRSGFSYEIIIADNNSTDLTPQIVKQFMSSVKNLRLVECKVQGKGEAVKQGMAEAKGQVRLFTDADNSTSIDQFSKMLPHFGEGYQIVIGSRAIKGAVLNPPQIWYRRLAGNCGNLFIQALLLPGIKDTQCGFKAITRTAAEKVFPLLKINRFAFDIELLALSKKFDFKVKEIPVFWVDRPFSHVKISDYFLVFWEVIKIRLWLMTNKYHL